MNLIFFNFYSDVGTAPHRRRRLHLLCLFLFSVFYLLFSTHAVSAATFSMTPAAGTFTVGSTFSISLYLNTQEQSVNALSLSLRFPPDKLQVVSPSVGQSILGVWVNAPRFDNVNGMVTMEGVIPGGLRTSGGLITTLSFRVKSVGDATLSFEDNSKALLNNGLGTNVLSSLNGAIYSLVLPPPQGPIVVSKTHPDQSKWYNNPTAVIRWSPEAVNVEGYSYVLDEEPAHTPNEISHGLRTEVIYKDLADGAHYFHVSAMRNGTWGGVTNFAIHIDRSPPAEFPILILPSDRLSRPQPIIEFGTTDIVSGVDHYELKIVPLSSGGQASDKAATPFFVEAQSPYIQTPLTLGDYDVIVRAYDNAGNYRESIKRFSIVPLLFNFISPSGIEVRGWAIIPWTWIYIVLGFFVFVLGYLVMHLKRWHRGVDLRRLSGVSEPVLKQLENLKKYQQKYGKLLLIFLAIGVALVFRGSSVSAATSSELGPPIISTVSRNISNQEIFYVGGKTEAADTEIVIYLQNLRTGETFGETVTSDNRGDWFYRHNSFLGSGTYILWAQAKLGGQLSPPSPQIQLEVQQTAIQFGASRLSYEVIYFSLFIAFLLTTMVLLILSVLHVYNGRRKYRLFLTEIRQAEAAIHSGFAEVKNDIERELARIHKVKLSKELSAEEKKNEEQLLSDLAVVEDRVDKKIWEIEKMASQY